MVDELSRCEMVSLGLNFIRGEIEAWDFDNRLFNLKTDDQACLQIRRQMWFCYGDTKKSLKIRMPIFATETVEMWMRWIFALSTKAEWQEIIMGQRSGHKWAFKLTAFFSSRLPPKLKFGKNCFWPFLNRSEWESFKDRYGPLPEKTRIDSL